MGAGADSTGEFADGSSFARGLETLESTAEFVIHQGHFQSKSSWLGMDAVAAANHRDELKLASLGGDSFAKRAHIFDEDVGGLNHLDGEGGVDDITAGESKVEPAAGGF